MRDDDKAVSLNHRVQTVRFGPEQREWLRPGGIVGGPKRWSCSILATVIQWPRSLVLELGPLQDRWYPQIIAVGCSNPVRELFRHEKAADAVRYVEGYQCPGECQGCQFYLGLGDPDLVKLK